MNVNNRFQAFDPIVQGSNQLSKNEPMSIPIAMMLRQLLHELSSTYYKHYLPLNLARLGKRTICMPLSCGKRCISISPSFLSGCPTGLIECKSCFWVKRHSNQIQFLDVLGLEVPTYPQLRPGARDCSGRGGGRWWPLLRWRRGRISPRNHGMPRPRMEPSSPWRRGSEDGIPWETRENFVCVVLIFLLVIFWKF